MYILGIRLSDNHLVRYALTKFYGIGPQTSHRICARVQVHDTCKIRDLTPTQVTSLTALLSAPQSTPPPNHKLAPSPFAQPQPKIFPHNTPRSRSTSQENKDPLRSLKIETDLKREIRENIAHQRMIGSYVGRRHAQHLPVRGQNTHHNARTARKLNRMERR